APDGKSVYVTAEGANTVTVIDTRNHSVLKQIPVGKRPRSVAFSPDGSVAYVPGEFDSTVTVIDTTSYGVLGVIHLGDAALRPMDAVVSGDNRFLYLTTGRGQKLLAVDTASRRVIRTLAVGARPWGLAQSPDGKRLFVANGPSNDVSVVDAATFQVV